MKYVIGWLRVKPGKRDQLLVRIRPFVAQSQAKSGIKIFEVNPSDSDPDVVVFSEGYDSDEVHQRHLATPEHVALLADIALIGIGGRFEHIYSERSSVHEVAF